MSIFHSAFHSVWLLCGIFRREGLALALRDICPLMKRRRRRSWRR